MISVLMGCDNVEWGGVDLALETPPARDTIVDLPEIDSAEYTLPLPTGPLLYLVQRQGSATTISALAEVGPEGLVDLAAPSDSAWWSAVRSLRMRPGTEFRAFADGVRVGTFTSFEGTERIPSFCGATSATPGRLELLPEVAGGTRFLAMESASAGGIPDRAFAPIQPQEADQATSRSILGQLIPQLGLSWPAGDLDNARASLHVLDVGAGNPAVLATFLYRDQFSIGPAPETAYALFFMAVSTGTQGYRPDFYWHRAVDDGGKAIPSYFSHLDWDGDGETEVLLDVMGEDDQWFAVVERTDGEWTLTHEVTCQ